MTQEDQAVFDQWLDEFATDEELALPYAEQVRAHIQWLSGEGECDLSNFLPEGDPQ